MPMEELLDDEVSVDITVSQINNTIPSLQESPNDHSISITSVVNEHLSVIESINANKIDNNTYSLRSEDPIKTRLHIINDDDDSSDIPCTAYNPCSNDINKNLQNIRKNNPNRVIVSHLNVNSFAGKFDAINTIIPGKVDVVVFSETKLDNSYPSSQFLMKGFTNPFRQDRNSHGGGIMIYVREDIPSKVLKLHSFPSDIEGIFVELTFRKVKWLLFGTYHPPNQNNKYFFENLGTALDVYIGKYDKFLLAGDFNIEEKETSLSDFLLVYNLKNSVNDKTCFKSLNNPTTIDLFLTNSKKSFQNTCSISTGISDFHNMVITVLKTTFAKTKPKI